MPSLAPLAIVASLAAAEPPQAEPPLVAPPPVPPLTIDWRAPAECPTTAELTAMTTTLLRAHPDGPTELEVHATVLRLPGRFQLELELRSPGSHMQRTLAADTCLPLARAVALVVAVHLDPMSASQRLPAPPPNPPLTNPLPPPPIILTPAPPEPGADDERPPGLSARPGSARNPWPAGQLGGHLRLEGGLGYGNVRAAAAELALLGGAWGERWRVEAGFTSVPTREVLAPGGATGGRLHRLAAVLRGCAVWRIPYDRDTFALHGCVGGELGAIGATGTRGVTDPSTRWSPWAALLLGPAARVRLVGPLGLHLGVEAVIALTRPTFTTGEAAQPVFSVNPIGVRAIVGLDLQFVARKRRARTTQ